MFRLMGKGEAHQGTDHSFHTFHSIVISAAKAGEGGWVTKRAANLKKVININSRGINPTLFKYEKGGRHKVILKRR